MDQLVQVLDSFAQLTGGYDYPAVSCVPVAIYQLVGAGD
jgi:hypothetical protein